MSYAVLPTEVKLNIVSRCDVGTLPELLRTNQESKELCLYSIKKELQEVVAKGRLCVGIFSPQNKKGLAELYYTKCFEEKSQFPPTRAVDLPMTGAGSKLVYATQEEYKSTFKLGDLGGTRDPLKSQEYSDSESEESEEEDLEDPSIMTLEVSEDARYVQFHFTLHMKTESDCIKLAEVNTRLEVDQTSGQLSFQGGKLKIAYKLEKGQEVEPQGPYDYDVLWNYQVQFTDFEIDNLYLLALIRGENTW